jgi:hypothetical protein
MTRWMAIIIYTAGFALGSLCWILIYERGHSPVMAQTKVESAPSPQRSLEMIDRIGVSFGPSVYLVRVRSCYYIVAEAGNGRVSLVHAKDCPSPIHGVPGWGKPK